MARTKSRAKEYRRFGGNFDPSLSQHEYGELNFQELQKNPAFGIVEFFTVADAASVGRSLQRVQPFFGLFARNMGFSQCLTGVQPHRTVQLSILKEKKNEKFLP